MATVNLGRVVGKSAYEIWLDAGNTGTIADYLAAMKGEPGNVSTEQMNTAISAAVDPVTSQLAAIGKLDATNLVANGDFSNGTTGWVTTGSTFTVTDGVGALLATASYGQILHVFAAGTVVGRKYYFAALVKADTPLARLACGGTFAYHTGSGQYERLSSVHTATSTGHGVTISDQRTSGWTGINVDNVIVLDLTAIFGAGKEPTAAQMDAYLARWPNGWFGGTVNMAQADKLLPALVEVRKLLLAENWITPTLLNGWVTGEYGTAPKYRKTLDNALEFIGYLKSGTLGVTAFQLASGYRPMQNSYFPIWTNGHVIGAASINTSGEFKIWTGTNTMMSLIGVRIPLG